MSSFYVVAQFRKIVEVMLAKKSEKTSNVEHMTNQILDMLPSVFSSGSCGEVCHLSFKGLMIYGAIIKNVLVDYSLVTMSIEDR